MIENTLLKCIFIFLLLITVTHQVCDVKNNKGHNAIRGQYKNVLQETSGTLLSSKTTNQFLIGNEGSLFRDTLYKIIWTNGYTQCLYAQSMNIRLKQKHELNTFKIWIFDRDKDYNYNDRLQSFVLYTKLGDSETKVYETSQAQSVLTITFPDQLVEEFRILNLGNTLNEGIHILKVEAYYKLKKDFIINDQNCII